MEKMNEEVYYAIWDNDKKDYMATGLNSRTKEEAKEALMLYFQLGDFEDDYYEVLESIRPDEFWGKEMPSMNFWLHEQNEPFNKDW